MDAQTAARFDGRGGGGPVGRVAIALNVVYYSDSYDYDLDLP